MALLSCPPSRRMLTHRHPYRLPRRTHVKTGVTISFPAAICLAATFILLASMATISAQTDPALLRAQRIELVDERGQVRARLNTEPGGEVVLRLMDQKGEIRVKLGASSNG